MTYKTYKFSAETNTESQIHEHFELQAAKEHAINLKVWGFKIRWLRNGTFTEVTNES